ncbi:helix-turn-helix domain-containing protein [Mycolicibacterium fortuitum]|uniref:helix-turn-helix domain-containing protein n=1 Tax=Mycolicibacterium fortuitum TaxID=1766 RepID=UPI000A65E38F|nr:helix-turn-helix domain-containing protein [Mycolicibacterium fortuitum]
MTGPRVLTPDSLLSIPEAAEQLRISQRHLFRLKRQGLIRTLRLGSRTLVPHR